MLLPELIQQYGYVAVLVGTFLEGETVLILGGLAAHRGYLDLRLVMLAAFFGTAFGDQLYYLIGRTRHDFLLAKKPAWRDKISKVEALVRDYRWPLLFGFRFLYGLRTVTPFTLGMVGISPRLFVPLNLVGALLWSVLIAGAGYLFGDLLENWLGELRRYELWLFLGVAGCGAVLGLGLWRAGAGAITRARTAARAAGVAPGDDGSPGSRAGSHPAVRTRRC